MLLMVIGSLQGIFGFIVKRLREIGSVPGFDEVISIKGVAEIKARHRGRPAEAQRLDAPDDITAHHHFRFVGDAAQFLRRRIDEGIVFARQMMEDLLWRENPHFCQEEIEFRVYG